MAADLRKHQGSYPGKPDEDIIHLFEFLSVQLQELLPFLENYFYNPLPPDGDTVKIIKVITTLTTKELALMNRLFIETGTFRVPNKTVLTEFMTRHVVTLQKEIEEEPSRKNFYNGLFESDLKTIASIGALLKRMENRLNDLHRACIEKEKEKRIAAKKKNGLNK